MDADDIFKSAILYPSIQCVNCKPAMFVLQQPILKRVLQQANDSVDKLIASVSDHFELCLAKCRTSSRVSQNYTMGWFSCRLVTDKE